MSTLIMMCGIPGSGKSTYAKKLKQLHPDWEYVSRDEIRYQYVEDKEHYFDHEYDVYKEFCNRTDMYLLKNKTVIADATNLNKKSRDKFLCNLTAKIDKIYIVVMDTPFEECMRRNSKREGITRVPDKVMYQMRNSFKMPNIATESFTNLIRTKG